MPTLTGENLIAGGSASAGSHPFTGIDPSSGISLEPPFFEASPEEIDAACEAARSAFLHDRRRSAPERADLLDAIAGQIEALGDELVERVTAETALPGARVRSERGRTTAQLRMFGSLVREGSWVDARIDRPDAARRPLPKADIRRMLVAIGPVAVFGASNFPLAFSVAGGDTASALAAGCPVVVKAHPSHPGTSELVGRAIQRAVEEVGFHPGTFSLLHGRNPDTSLALVRHPHVRAVGFTGSLRAGRAIYDAAAARPDPILVFAEMGSVNPVFLLPGALAERKDEIVRGLVGSVTLGAGQFCTSPGLVFGLAGEGLDAFARQVGAGIQETPAFTMLNSGIRDGYQRSLQEVASVQGVELTGRSELTGNGGSPAHAAVFATDHDTFLANERLHEEVFGPATLVVRCADSDAMTDVARRLEGNLTATLHGTELDLRDHEALIHVLEEKVGRLIFNGFPTGVEVCASMHHGGPYPATTDVRSTSVGTAAIYRFARPICYQNFPQAILPPELRDENERGIWRTVDGQLNRERGPKP